MLLDCEREPVHHRQGRAQQIQPAKASSRCAMTDRLTFASSWVAGGADLAAPVCLPGAQEVTTLRFAWDMMQQQQKVKKGAGGTSLGQQRAAAVKAVRDCHHPSVADRYACLCDKSADGAHEE
jgi:hypothetical protein